MLTWWVATSAIVAGKSEVGGAEVGGGDSDGGVPGVAPFGILVALDFEASTAA